MTVRVRLTSLPKGTLLARDDDESQEEDQRRFLQDDLGLQVQELSAEIAEQLGIERRTRGVVVTTVQPGSIAQRKGMRVGMVILQIGDRPIHSVDDFRQAVSDQSLEEGLETQSPLLVGKTT